jgi:drug/metabolite transporter (DMT)-like permease
VPIIRHTGHAGRRTEHPRHAAVDQEPVVSTREASSRGRLPATASGTNLEDFGATEWALLAAVATMWGSSFLFMAIGLESLRPGVVTLARIALGAGALALVPRARSHVDRVDLPRVAILGVIWMGIPLTLFPIAQQWIDSSVAGILNAGMPLTTAAWATLLLRRAPGPRALLGLALGFAGIVAVFLPELAESRANALGSGLVVVAVVLYGLAANVAVPLQQRYGSLPVLWRAQLAALVVVLPFGLASLPGSRFAWAPVLAMVPLGVLCTGLAFVLMTTLVGRVGGPRGTIAIYFVPLVAIGLGLAIRGEAITPPAVLGTALVLVGAWLASRREEMTRVRPCRGAGARSRPSGATGPRLPGDGRSSS